MFNVYYNKDLLRYIISFQSGKRISEYINIAEVSRRGFLSVLKYQYKHKTGKSFISDVIYYAALEGHLEVLKWLKKVGIVKGGPRRQRNAINIAYRNGHSEVVKWLQENSHS